MLALHTQHINNDKEIIMYIIHFHYLVEEAIKEFFINLFRVPICMHRRKNNTIPSPYVYYAS